MRTRRLTGGIYRQRIPHPSSILTTYLAIRSYPPRKTLCWSAKAVVTIARRSAAEISWGFALRRVSMVRRLVAKQSLRISRTTSQGTGACISVSGRADWNLQDSVAAPLPPSTDATESAVSMQQAKIGKRVSAYVS